ncbi:MAG: penicillin-binding protein 2 [Puniceicoccales bacterium]|nr:penicillin-binding protein 2 [Puniceicoccales bacterium]
MVLVGRVLLLCHFDRDYYKNFVNSARATKQTQRAIRGQIRDRNGFVLAITTMKIDIGVDPYTTDLQKNRDKIDQLAVLLGKTSEEIMEYFRRETFIRQGKKQQLRWKKIATIEDNDLYARIMALDIKGVYGSRKNERIYPNNELASHVIGFVNKEGIAVSGVERFMDEFLRGQDGCLESERDGKRKEVALFRKTVIGTKNGAYVDLTIDLRVQTTVENALARTMAELKAKSGSVIVSDPTTGEILALCNAPTFDCNAYYRSEISHLRNRAITDFYEPGSVFKIVPFSIALQRGLFSLEQRFDCNQATFSYHGKTYNLPKDYTQFGQLSAVDVLRKSSNRGAAQIAILLGERGLYHAARAFGFGSRTGYGFDGEVAGILPPVERWDSLTITRLPMGHAIGATPLQVHQAMGVIGSGGYLLEPKVIGRICDENGETIIRAEPHIIRRVLNLDVAKKMREILSHPGNATSSIEGVKLAYKTGTSQKIIGKKYSSEHHISSCSGFFPAEEPRFLVTVVLDDPKMANGGVAYGIRAAYPLLAEIARTIIISKGLGH